MKKLLLGIILLSYFQYSNAQVSICSWNLKDFGTSKSDKEISFIADVLKRYDIIAIQEVVAGYGGPQAVARLADELNLKGSKWDFTISDPTSSSAYKTERYAFLWKTSKITRKGNAWLEKKYHLVIDREPYYMTVVIEGIEITLVNFHAITKSKQPETEVKYFKFLPANYLGKELLFLGDFNLTQSHTVFNPLKSLGYRPVLVNQKTSLRTKCIGGDCLASEFDNIFYNASKVNFIRSGVIHFYENFSTINEARLVSDHVPIYFQFSLN